MSASLLWEILFYGWCFSEVYIALGRRTRNASGNTRDRGTQLLLWIVIFVSIFACEWIGGSHAPTMFGGAHWLKTVAIFVFILRTCHSMDGNHFAGKILQRECRYPALANRLSRRNISLGAASFVPRHAGYFSGHRHPLTKLDWFVRRSYPHDAGRALPHSRGRNCSQSGLWRCLRFLQQNHSPTAPLHLLTIAVAAPFPAPPCIAYNLERPMPNTPDPRTPLLHLIATLSFRLGEFTLSSGAHSDYYIDCRTTTLHAEGGRLAGLALYDLIRQHKLHPQAVGGLTMGADPLVSNIASASAWDHLQNQRCSVHPRISRPQIGKDPRHRPPD